MADIGAGSTAGGYVIAVQNQPAVFTTLTVNGFTSTGNITGASINTSGALQLTNGSGSPLIASAGYLDIRANQSSYNNGIILRRSTADINHWANIGLKNDTTLFMGVQSASVGMTLDTVGVIGAVGLNITGDSTLGSTNQKILNLQAVVAEIDTRSVVNTLNANGSLATTTVKDGATTVKTITFSYNSDDTLNTVQEVVGGKTITTTYTYTNGECTGSTKTVV